jgi:ADP-ribose pyrophosphatase YjhB (NUDIX family)
MMKGGKFFRKERSVNGPVGFFCVEHVVFGLSGASRICPGRNHYFDVIQIVKPKNKKEEQKVTSTQYFVNTLPDKPALPSNQVVMPIAAIEKMDHKPFGWLPVLEGDRIIGLRNPALGQFIHSVVAEVDSDGKPIKVMYDLVVWDDGVLGPDGLSTPGSVVAPIERREDGLYVHCFWQWRPALSDFALTLSGGFALFVGETPEAVAAREAREERAIKLLNTVLRASSSNRANSRTLVNVGFAEFEQTGTPLTSEDEKMVGKMAIRIDIFPWSIDRFTNEAVFLAASYLGLIRPKEMNSIDDTLEALIKAIKAG